MGSNALAGLHAGLDEIEALQRAKPSQPLAAIQAAGVHRAIGRAKVVLLSSHFERYIYASNEEAVEALVAATPPATSLPELLRLEHAREPVEALAEMQWTNRGARLTEYSAREAALWRDGDALTYLAHERLLTWMKAPGCKEIQRHFKNWGIPDIFGAVTRSTVNRNRLRLRLQELVDKRNNIAHGDFNTQAEYADIISYRAAVKKFCESADKQMSQAVARILKGPRPW